jgi:hypothetical protein
MHILEEKIASSAAYYAELSTAFGFGHAQKSQKNRA